MFEGEIKTVFIPDEGLSRVVKVTSFVNDCHRLITCLLLTNYDSYYTVKNSDLITQ